MPYVNVPGFPRPVLIDLHDPVDLDRHLIEVIATPDPMTAEQFAETMSAHAFDGTFDVVSLLKVASRADWARLAKSAQLYEKARRALLRGQIGRPRNTLFSELDDFVIIVRYFKVLGDPQSVSSAANYWAKAGLKKPSDRQIEQKIRGLRGVQLIELGRIAELVRKKHGLPPLPRKKPVHTRSKRTQ